jgi:hypothetical protein
MSDAVLIPRERLLKLHRVAYESGAHDTNCAVGNCWVFDMIAASPPAADPLDVERLAKAIASTFAEPGVSEVDRRQARKVAAEYARLTREGEQRWPQYCNGCGVVRFGPKAPHHEDCPLLR